MYNTNKFTIYVNIKKEFMDIEFEDDYLADLYEGKQVRGKPKFQKELIKQFIKTINKLQSSNRIEDLMMFKSLKFEKLVSSDLYSVRVNIQYRLEFKIFEDEIIQLSIVKLSNHYEK